MFGFLSGVDDTSKLAATSDYYKGFAAFGGGNGLGALLFIGHRKTPNSYMSVFASGAGFVSGPSSVAGIAGALSIDIGGQ